MYVFVFTEKYLYIKLKHMKHKGPLWNYRCPILPGIVYLFFKLACTKVQNYCCHFVVGVGVAL